MDAVLRVLLAVLLLAFVLLYIRQLRINRRQRGNHLDSELATVEVIVSLLIHSGRREAHLEHELTELHTSHEALWAQYTELSELNLQVLSDYDTIEEQNELLVEQRVDVERKLLQADEQLRLLRF